MSIFGPICILTAYLLWVSHCRRRLEQLGVGFDRRWYFSWIARGLVAPILLWVLLNVGHSPFMPAIVKVIPRRNVAPPPTIIFLAGAAPNAPPIIVPSPPKYVGVGPVGYVAFQTAPALAAIGSYWGAATLGWFVVALAGRAKNRGRFIRNSLIWCTAMMPLVGLVYWFNGLGILGFVLSLWFGPIVLYVISLEAEPDPLPQYTSAVAKLKFGKYAEAEQAIIAELEKCQNDFDGWMMLAELYAKQFQDLGEAERTIRDLCNDPATTISEKAVAFHKLADWHLELRQDPLSARRALDEIVTRMPGTHLARMALLRQRQIPNSQQEWIEQQGHGRKIQMPALNEDFTDADTGVEPVSEAAQAEAERVARQYVERLKANPNDIASRERLARLFAERLGQAGLGIQQLQLLAGMPDQPPNKMAEWLSLIAMWQLKLLENREAAQETLRRLISEFPHTAQAFAAQRRLKLIEMET